MNYIQTTFNESKQETKTLNADDTNPVLNFVLYYNKNIEDSWINLIFVSKMKFHFDTNH